MVAAKLEQSRVLVTKFRQNRLTLKGRSAGQRHRQTDRQTDSQAGGFLRLDCAPRSECPSSRICGQNPRNDADATFLDPHVSVVHCCCSAGTAITDAACYDRREVAGMANFKMCILRQFCSNRVEIFFTTHRRHRRQNNGPEF